MKDSLRAAIAQANERWRKKASEGEKAKVEVAAIIREYMEDPDVVLLLKLSGERIYISDHPEIARKHGGAGFDYGGVALWEPLGWHDEVRQWKTMDVLVRVARIFMWSEEKLRAIIENQLENLARRGEEV